MTEQFESGFTRHRRRKGRLGGLELLTVLHVSVFLVAATWGFGGQADWVRGPLTAWGGAGTLITLALLLRKDGDRAALRLLWWAVPPILLTGLVLVASTNPSFREVRDEGEILLVNTGGRPGLPSSARPALARQAVIEFDAIWLACFNLSLVVRRRRALRAVLLVAAINAVALAIFGTVQRLLHAPGLFFGLVPTRQTYFFASFVYHNHWGAFMILMIALCLGLVIHYARRSDARDAFHSPAFTGLVLVLILAATIPLSGSRSSTILVTLLLSGAFLHWLFRLLKKRRYHRESVMPVVFLATAAAGLALGAIWYLARDTINLRFALTEQQIHHARIAHRTDARVQLYRDTWHMAMAKPWFGWGMASYPHVFTLFNTRESIDRLPIFYHDAHSDWLQAVAEHGIVGSALLALCALVPLLSIRRAKFDSPIANYLFAGCAIVLLYAWLEFPFGNYAVVLCWWACFFIAVQYTRLTDAKFSRESESPSSTV